MWNGVRGEEVVELPLELVSEPLWEEEEGGGQADEHVDGREGQGEGRREGGVQSNEQYNIRTNTGGTVYGRVVSGPSTGGGGLGLITGVWGLITGC